MARYIAKRPIDIGGARAFAAGAQVPAGHVERFNLLADGLDGPAVVEVSDDVVGDRPDLADGIPDNTPPTVSIGHRLLYGDPETAEPETTPEPETADSTDQPPPTTPAATSTTKAKPATGATTTTTVTEG